MKNRRTEQQNLAFLAEPTRVLLDLLVDGQRTLPFRFLLDRHTRTHGGKLESADVGDVAGNCR